MSTTKAANDTTLAQIIPMVGSAQGRRAPSEQWVEKFARIYTPVVMALAIAIFLVPPLLLGGGWEVWFYRALVLLVIACPCALVISTPVTIVAALAGAAKQGILVKGGVHLETPARLEGNRHGQDWNAHRGASAGRGDRGARQSERRGPSSAGRGPRGPQRAPDSARAILAKAIEGEIAAQPAEAVQAITGRGMTGRVSGREVWLGSRRYLDERAISSTAILARADALSGAGRTIGCGRRQPGGLGTDRRCRRCEGRKPRTS